MLRRNTIAVGAASCFTLFGIFLGVWLQPMLTADRGTLGWLAVITGLLTAILSVLWWRTGDGPKDVVLVSWGTVQEEPPGSVRHGVRWIATGIIVRNSSLRAASIDFHLVYSTEDMIRKVPSEGVYANGKNASLPFRMEPSDFQQFQVTFSDYGASAVPRGAFRLRVVDLVSGATADISTHGQVELDITPKGGG